MATIQDLITHMRKHKDAVVIIGEDVAPELGVNKISDEDGESIFNRRTMTKNTKKFWDFYNENIKIKNLLVNPIVYQEVKKLEDMELLSKVICTNTHGIYKNALNLKGISNKIKCSRCGQLYDGDYTDTNAKCTNCDNTRLRPDCLLYGENYHPAVMKEFTDSIFLAEENKEVVPNTHTLILIGVDMDEDLIAEMYENYLLVRERIEEPCYIVLITEREEDVRLLRPDFNTTYDINESITKLVNLF